MNLAIFVPALALLTSTSGYGTYKIGEACAGTETLQIGTQAPRTVPYSLTFSADVSAKSYCYDRCGPDQTYAISNGDSNPMKLADLHSERHTRVMTFDRRSGVLTDYQNLDLGFTRVVRNASAKCRPAAFHEPAAGG